MRLYPNFDFLDFDYDLLPMTEDTSGSFGGPKSSHMDSIGTPYAASTSTGPTQVNYTMSASNNAQMQMMPETRAYMGYAADTEPEQQQQPQPSVQQMNSYSDLSDFNTLATVAAQSPHLNQEIQYRHASNNPVANGSQIMKVRLKLFLCVKQNIILR